MGDVGRLVTAMVTPFTDLGDVDYGQAKVLTRALLESGNDGVIVAGTTGESPTLTKEEKLRLFAEVKSVAEDAMVIAGVGSNNTADSITLAKAAESYGVDGLLLVVPYYNKPTQEGIKQHFRAIAGSVNLPCILYNVPSRTGVNMTAETALSLGETPNIIGVKEASGDLAQISSIIDGSAVENFRVWSGNDNDTLAIIQRGGYGLVGVASHLVGRQMSQMIGLAATGDLEQATAIDDALQGLYRDLFLISNPIPIKHALNYIGFNVGNCRLPLCDADKVTAVAIEAAVRAVTIDLPVPTATS